MLAELAAPAGGVPLGVHGGQVETNPRPMPFGRFPSAYTGVETESQAQPGPRSMDYVTVLNQYLARLSATGHPMDAVRVYRRELDRKTSKNASVNYTRPRKRAWSKTKFR